MDASDDFLQVEETRFINFKERGSRRIEESIVMTTIEESTGLSAGSHHLSHDSLCVEKTERRDYSMNVNRE